MTPFFSIIVPVYRVNEIFLDECINSILAQTFRDFELILVDDGSPDNCGTICDRFAMQDERIRVIHQGNQGVSVARNTGIINASAEWILFVDGDDWVEPDMCEILHKYLEEQECEMLMFHAIRESAGKSIVMDYGFTDGYVYDLSIPQEREFLYRRVMGVGVPKEKNKKVYPAYYSWDKVYRRSFLIDNSIAYPAGLPKSEDKVFILSCLEKLTKLYCVDDALYHYRMNDESVCHRYSKDIDKHRIRLTNILGPIAVRMDKELSELFHDPSYHRISDDYKRFVFGLITDVLYLKFYHDDNPERRERRREALFFLKTEPFGTVVREIPYSELSNFSKVKKFLLKHNFVSLFCYISLRYRHIHEK